MKTDTYRKAEWIVKYGLPFMKSHRFLTKRVIMKHLDIHDEDHFEVLKKRYGWRL